MNDFTTQKANCSDELIIDIDENNYLYYVEAYWALWFDVDKYFGITTTEESWLNMYTRYYEDGTIKTYLVLDEYDSIKDIDWTFSKLELTYIKEKMNEHCRNSNGISLDDMIFIIRSENRLSHIGNCKDSFSFIKNVVKRTNSHDEAVNMLSDFEKTIKEYDTLSDKEFTEAMDSGCVPMIYKWYMGVIPTEEFIVNWFGK